MSLRTVALETPRLCRSTNVFDPIGSLVDTKSATMARSTSNRRSSAVPNSVTSQFCPYFTVISCADSHRERLGVSEVTGEEVPSGVYCPGDYPSDHAPGQ